MEVLRIRVELTGHYQVDGFAQQAVMLPFTGRCDSPLFTGEILPGGVDTQRIEKDGRCTLSARYMLAGRDSAGEDCRLFIENVGIADPGQPFRTRPTIRTDSRALRWLENATLSGCIESAEDHIEIVLSCEDRPGTEWVQVQRAGLTLQGCLQKTTAEPCPLVIMMHGFGGDMEGGWFQTLSDSLNEQGMATLRFDFNGHGRSQGRFCDMTPYNEIEDAAAFLQYALDRGEFTKIMLLGHSQGGVVAGMLAGYYPDWVDRLVMLAPAAVLKTDALAGRCMQAVYDPAHVPQRVNVDGRHEVGGLYFRMAQTLPIYEVTARFAGEALVVLPGQDAVVSSESVERYARSMPGCRMETWATLNHGLGGEEHEALMARIASFLAAGK